MEELKKSLKIIIRKYFKQKEEILQCGDYKVGKLDIPDFLNEFYSIIQQSDSIEIIANQLNEECKIRGYSERIKW